MHLRTCTETWGEVERREGVPPILTYEHAVYVPFCKDQAWGVFGADGEALAGSVDLHGPDAEPQHQELIWDAREVVTETSNETYIYGGVLNPHFGHFLINSLSRLWPLAQADRPSGKILFHAVGTADAWFTLPFLRDIFGALGLTPSSIEIFHRPVRLRSLIVPTPSFQEQHFIHDVYRDMCRKAGEKILGDRETRSGLAPVYLSKTGLKAGVGRVINEEPLEATLAAAGVEIVRPERLSFADQIALFVDRPAILGTISSSFHTSIFAPPNAQIVVLSTIPGPNSNFSLIDAVNHTRSEYVYADGTEVVDDCGDTFLTNFYLPDPEGIADDLLEKIGWGDRVDPQRRADRLANVGRSRGSRSKSPNAGKGSGSMSLYSLFLNNTGRPIHKSGHYFFAYERHFSRYVGEPVTFLEIGAGNGGSSQMWKRWLGPLARIVTIDINPICRQFEDEQVSVRIGDQSDPTFLQSLIDEFGRPDVVLDDGSHHMVHVNASFDFLYPKIAPNGVYMIEDMHTAYWPDYGGGLRAPTSAIERFKSLIDVMNADHVRDGSIEPDVFTRTTVAMTAYDSILVFERSPIINKAMLMIGDDNKRVNY